MTEENDIRWAVNVMLEKIAEKFEGWETMDLWRSDAASTVRSFKHDLAVGNDVQDIDHPHPTVSNCHQEGSRARERGEPMTENPYPDWTNVHGQWNDGWRGRDHS